MSTSVQVQTETSLAERYEALFQVSRAISAHRDPKALFSTLARELRQVVRFDFIGIAQYDEVSGRTWWHLSEKCDKPCDDPGSDCRPEQTMAYWVYQNQVPMVIPLVSEETRFPQMTEQLAKYGIQSACALPLTTVHRRVGILALGSEHPDAFADDEISFLSLVASQIAVAIDDALNFEASRLAQTELQRERDRLQLLLDVNNSVVSRLELRDVLRAVAANVRRAMQCEGVGVFLPDRDESLLRMYALDFPNSKGAIREEISLPVHGTVTGKVFLTGVPFVGERPDPDQTIPEAYRLLIEEGIRSLCFLPLRNRDRILGVLALAKLQEHAFREEDVHFLAQIASQAAIAVDNALAYRQITDLKDRLAQEKLYLEDEIRTELKFDEMVGSSPALRQVLRQVQTVAPTDSAVLILGETGTGKELVARAIHNLSQRKDRTFVKLNCAAIPTGLLESELFGHEKGAFTGAIAQRVGRFELASNGTVFLDEVGEIPLELQPKLLRVLQEREFERLGSSRTLRSDARLVAATNRDLTEMVEEQKFRSDLFYRLNVFPVRVPALRERPEDIPLLVRHFAQQYARRSNKSIETVPSDVMRALAQYHWPGNVRELQNVVERAVILSSGPVLNVPLADLKLRARTETSKKPDTLQEAERKHILAVLEETKWVVGGPSGAAARLGMNRSTLQFRMKKLGIARPA